MLIFITEQVLSLSWLHRHFTMVKIALISTDKIIGIACDVTNEDDVMRTVQKAQQWMGKIDVLVNAAGVNKDTLLVKTERETIMHQLNTNLIGTMFTCKAVIKPMIRNRRGCIINMGECFNLQFYSLRYREYIFHNSKHATVSLWNKVKGHINVFHFTGSVIGSKGNIGQTAYSASKAGIEGFTKSLAKEVATKGTTANVIAPGNIYTRCILCK